MIILFYSFSRTLFFQNYNETVLGEIKNGIGGKYNIEKGVCIVINHK